jgi:hypothetical protein
MIAGPWSSRAEYEAWWKANVRELNRLAVYDREEYERVSRAIDEFNRSNPQ